MMTMLRTLACLMALQFAPLGGDRAAQDCPCEKPVIGWVERVVMQDVDMQVKARIDTGASVSSLDANILELEAGSDGSGEKVRFRIKNGEEESAVIERTIVEWSEIKGKGTSSTIRRPVVTLDICLGGKRLEGRINLADRSRFLYPVLIGRNLIRTGGFLVDSDKTYMRDPGC
jgi:hypothetical protein